MPQAIIYLSEEQDKKIKDICEREDKSKADMIIELIKRGLKECKS
jgi:predicted DNA-binding protein